MRVRRSKELLCCFLKQEAFLLMIFSRIKACSNLNLIMKSLKLRVFLLLLHVEFV